jgi:hypothetical protein
LAALVFASQSPYPGRQTVAYSRNVRRNWAKKRSKRRFLAVFDMFYEFMEVIK